MIAPERIVTLTRPIGFRIVADCGAVHAESSARRGLLASALRFAGTIFGLIPADIVTDAERARARCLDELGRSADAAGANGVIGVVFEALVRTDGATLVRATGTAVVLEPES